LRSKDAVGVVTHIPDRTGLKTYLHPCFLAFRRSFVEAHALDLLPHGDGDPCCRITEHLLQTGRFNEAGVTPLLPTAHELELFPQFRHDPAFGATNLRHGFGTTYGGLVVHLWFWRNVAQRLPVRGADGSIIVTEGQMDAVLQRLSLKFGPHRRDVAPAAAPVCDG
jgi:hypothetical protein